MDEQAWANRLGAGSLVLTFLSLLDLVLDRPLGMEHLHGGGRLSVLSGLSPVEEMIFLFGPPLLLSLAGLGLYLRLDAEERAEAWVALFAPLVIVAIPVAVVVLWMIAMASMGPV